MQFFTLTLEICGSTIVSEYFLGLMILGTTREVPFQPMEIQSCVWYSLIIPRHILCQNLNWHWCWFSPVSWTAPRHRNPMFDVFVIAVYLLSLRCKNFLRSECERRGRVWLSCCLSDSPQYTDGGGGGHPQLKYLASPGATQALNPKDKSPPFRRYLGTLKAKLVISQGRLWLQWLQK